MLTIAAIIALISSSTIIGIVIANLRK